MLLTVSHDSFLHDDGSVVVLTGVDENGKTWRFGADFRIAYDLLGAAIEGEITVEVEDWQLLGKGL